MLIKSVHVPSARCGYWEDITTEDIAAVRDLGPSPLGKEEACVQMRNGEVYGIAGTVPQFLSHLVHKSIEASKRKLPADPAKDKPIGTAENVKRTDDSFTFTLKMTDEDWKILTAPPKPCICFEDEDEPDRDLLVLKDCAVRISEIACVQSSAHGAVFLVGKINQFCYTVATRVPYAEVADLLRDRAAGAKS